MQPDNATAERLAEVVRRCPSGALKNELVDCGTAGTAPLMRCSSAPRANATTNSSAPSARSRSSMARAWSTAYEDFPQGVGAVLGTSGRREIPDSIELAGGPARVLSLVAFGAAGAGSQIHMTEPGAGVPKHSGTSSPSSRGQARSAPSVRSRPSATNGGHHDLRGAGFGGLPGAGRRWPR
ncbi:(4Fe-4S)-binding protein [Streptomyces sp. NPDC005794]|uniref:(4Fe-4S)-binding protein n=1 Tax=Streptomyces sp. NPDC005794 TaxID=3364733 RepID=UPI0036C221ED